MVVIESVPSEAKVVPPNAPEAAFAEPSDAAEEGYASDAFDTASESDVIENDEEQINRNHHHQSVSIPAEDHSFHDSLNDDQLVQKALEDANDAKLQGNDLFKNTQYEDALLKYDLALQLVAEVPSSAELCSVCHGNRAACFLKMGKYEDSVKECTKALELNSSYKKILLRRAEAHEKLDHYEEAVADVSKFLELEPSNFEVRRSLVRLESLASEKREKMKEEMIGKLKDVGNTILGKFGMSVDNFKAVQDPKTAILTWAFISGSLAWKNARNAAGRNSITGP